MDNSTSRQRLTANRHWDDVCKPIIETALGVALTPATLQQDRCEATDWITEDGTSIMQRVRSLDYLAFADEFTLRAYTEEPKVSAGYGRYLFYGFGEGTTIYRWTILDMDAFRYNDAEGCRCQVQPTLRHCKHDGDFWAYKISGFPPCPPIVIASSHEIEPYKAISPSCEKYIKSRCND